MCEYTTFRWGPKRTRTAIRRKQTASLGGIQLHPSMHLTSCCTPVLTVYQIELQLLQLRRTSTTNGAQSAMRVDQTHRNQDRWESVRCRFAPRDTASRCIPGAAMLLSRHFETHIPKCVRCCDISEYDATWVPGETKPGEKSKNAFD